MGLDIVCTEKITSCKPKIRVVYQDKRQLKVMFHVYYKFIVKHDNEFVMNLKSHL